MASTNEAKIKFTAETSEFTAAIKEANSEMSSLRAEMKLNDAQFENTGDSAAYLQKKSELLESQLEENRKKQEALSEKLEKAKTIYGDNSDEVSKLETQLTYAEIEEQKLQSQLTKTNEKIDEQGDSADDTGDEIDDLSDHMDDAEEESDSWAVALGNLASEAISSVISSVKELASEIVDLGMDTETSFAKLETIAGTENIDALTESINELSTETGVSSAELAEVAYNAISAGSSAEDAMDMVESATKLATAGFTDSSAALSVLSTVMNSYGDSAGTVEEISDSLITVQNLGVTTVDELASNMGKAIATGSAYSVNLGNLEAAYIALTKSGISTAEGTTYINSMLNELGDSGSDVSVILQEETGKSFTELMEDGKSLGDVLDILYDSVDGDSTALMNLWSSAEAGKASNAIVTQGFQAFEESLDAVTNSAGATETAYATMADTTATKMEIMKAGFQQLGLKIYDGLEEPLGNAITYITETVIPGVSSFIDTASEKFNEFATFFQEEILPVIQDVWDKISSAIGTVVEWFQTYVQPIAEEVFGAISTFFTETFLPAVQEVWDKVSTAVGEVVDWFKEDVLPRVQSIMESVAGAFQSAWELIQVVWDIVKPYFEAIWTAIKTVFSVVKDVLGKYFSIAWNYIKAVWDVASSYFQLLWDTISGIFEVVKDVLSGDFSGAWEAIKNIFKNVKTWFTEHVWDKITGIFDSVGTWFKDKFQGAWDSIKNVFSGVKTFFTGIWDDIKGVFSDIGSAISDAISGAVKKAINSVLNTAASIINGFIGAINTAISIINAIPGVNIGKLSKLEVEEFAEGGVVTKPTLGVFGEAGDEAIVPLKNNTEWIANVAKELADVLPVSGSNVINTAAESAIENSLGSLADAIYALANRPIELNINGRSFATATSGDIDTALGTRQALTARGLSLA